MTHLIILQNGLNGASVLMAPVKSFLENHLQANFIVVVSDVNNFHRTWDGLDAGGQRLADFIQDKIKEHHPTHISMIGHSLGGLLLRNCIGILDQRGVFNHVEPYLYASIASPHLGVPDLSHFKQGLARWIIYKTGPELLIEDPRQLLVDMSTPGTTFMTDLSKFAKRIAYGNLVGDSSVSFQSACICGQDIPGRVYTLDKLFQVNSMEECEVFTEPLWSAVICDNLSGLSWDRQAIDLTGYWSIHNAIMGKSVSRHTAVLQDLITKLGEIV